jgi:hypothetical protein
VECLPLCGGEKYGREKEDQIIDAYTRVEHMAYRTLISLQQKVHHVCRSIIKILGALNPNLDAA